MKRFYVWKYGINNGDNTEWEELKRHEFLRLVNSNKADGRFFSYFPGSDEATDTYVFESTEKGYKSTDSIRGIYKYNKRVENEYPIEFVSMDSEIELADGESVSLHDIIPDESADFEEQLITKIWVRSAVASLEHDEQQLINWMFLEPITKTEQEIAIILGVSQAAVSQKLKKIYKKLEILLIKS